MAQSTVDKHGYKMKNLREICSRTKGMTRYGSYHIEIAYDTENGKICIEEFVGPVGSHRVVWVDGVVSCGYLYRPMTQQEIADQIADHIREHEARMELGRTIEEKTGDC